MPNLTNNLTILAAKIDIVGKNNGAGEKDLVGNVTNILNAIILVLGLAAVAFIIVGGVNYITSNGEAAKVEKAKKTILYACIGLIISALAFAIVNFVISDILKQGSSSPSSYTTKEDCKEAGYTWKDKKCQEK